MHCNICGGVRFRRDIEVEAELETYGHWEGEDWVEDDRKGLEVTKNRGTARWLCLTTLPGNGRCGGHPVD